jgi:4-hydroxy-tetrahydrodipicolinate reductase
MFGLKYLIFGVGPCGQLGCRVLLEEKADIVAAYSRSKYIGEDIGKLVDRAPCGCIVQPVGSFSPRPGLADVAVFCTTGEVSDLLGDAKRCLENGIRVLTICEEAAYPWSHDPASAHALDAAAKAGGSALISSGLNDVAMMHFPVSLASCSHSIQRIESNSLVGVGYSPEALKYRGIGLRLDEYRRLPVLQKNATIMPLRHLDKEPMSVCGSVAEAIVANIGAHLKRVLVSVEPVLACRELPAPMFGHPVREGDVCGLEEVARAETDEGVEVLVRVTRKIFDEGDESYIGAHVEGKPPLTMTVKAENFSQCLMPITFNRIPDLMAATPGFISVDRLLPGRWRVPGKIDANSETRVRSSL